MIEVFDLLKQANKDQRLEHLWMDFLSGSQMLADNGVPPDNFPLFDKEFPPLHEEVCWGTLRAPDLFCKFLYEMFTRGLYRSAYLYYREVYYKLLSCMEDEHESSIPTDPRFWDWDYMEDANHFEFLSDILYEMAEKLDSIAPKGCYFGTHEGDGSLFGYWQVGE